ncbi:MAG: hypothetical protein GDA51_12860 [Ekhidna sp.]|nr:hypothetical protein [Ekhidna sp.]
MSKIISSVVKLLFFIGFHLLFAQKTKYVQTEKIETAQTISASYYFTESVTIKAPSSGSIVLSSTGGDKFITPIPTSPPPSQDQNYVRVEEPKVPVSDEKTLTLMSTTTQKSVSYAYSDGMGRETMSVAVAAGPQYEDLVQPGYYNAVSARPDRSYMPYPQAAGSGGAYASNAYNRSVSFYTSPTSSTIATDPKPYSYMEYDPRGRVKSVIAPGEAWHTNSHATARKTRYAYKVHNPGTDFKVFKWRMVNGLPQNSGVYGARSLSVVETTDPEGLKMRTVKDLRGLTITTQIFDPTDSKWYGSYSVYDDYGRVVFVVPPSLTAGLDHTFPNVFTASQARALMFQYVYDERGRLVEQQAPGGPRHYNVYDQWDRLVMTRYEGQKWEGRNSWTFYKYDALNRQVVSGQVKTNDSRARVMAKMGGGIRYESLPSNSGVYTEDNAFPRFSSDYSLANSALLTVNYYDNYQFLNDPSWDTENRESEYHFQSVPGYTGNPLTAPLDMPTGSKVRVLGSDRFLNTVIYYDDKYRQLQLISKNHLTYYTRPQDVITYAYDWEGSVLKSHHEYHYSSGTSVTYDKRYEYDHRGRLRRVFQNTGGSGEVLLAAYTYNAVGELVEKRLHSTDGGHSFLQSVDYRYTLQGHIKSINDPDDLSSDGDLFGMDYYYEGRSPISGTDKTNRYNGLLNAMTWNATGVTPAVNPGSGPNGTTKYGVGFNYDGRGRLKGTKYAEAAGSAYLMDRDHFNMTASYDDNGNLDLLTRKSDNIVIDKLDYDYPNGSNQLRKVTDGGTAAGFDNLNRGMATDYHGEFSYDALTGNMTADAHKELYLSYNHLQLVDKITFERGSGNVVMVIDYTYDAVGNRLSKTIKDKENHVIAKVDYLGPSEFLNDELCQLSTDEGRVYAQNGSYYYEYYITDHQANNRLAFGRLPEQNVYLATMEDARSAQESSEFAFPSNVRSSASNHTPLGSKSVALNGFSRPLGPAKVLNIKRGDKVEMEFWAKYSAGGWDNSIIPSLVSAVLGGFGASGAGTGAESASGSLSRVLSSPAAGGLFSGPTGGRPRAYLQYIFFDADYVYQRSNSGFLAVVSTSKGQYDRYATGPLTFDQDGYLFVYLVNESNRNQDVYFDDLKITHTSGDAAFRVTQINDYYPFGLKTSNSWRAPNYTDPGVLYQSSYASYDSLTGYYDFLSRSYDPALGRFFAVDPVGQFSSPYVGMGNVPHLTIDPNGELAWFVPIIIGAAIGGTTSGIQSANSGGTFLGGFWRGALIGAAAGTTGVGATAWASGSSFTASIGVSTGFGAIAAGGASSGFVSGGLTSSIHGGSFLGGAWRGAVTGAAGASLGTVGGSVESFAGQVGVGIGTGAMTGFLGSALNGGDIGRGALFGGAFGGVFATATSPQLRNAVRGQEFRSNSRVLAGFVGRGDYQGALDYFGFEGTYDPNVTSKNYQAKDYWGVTNPKTGEIRYGNLAFENYATLKATYFKESYHSANILSGRGLAELPADFQGLGFDYYLEEVHGYVHAFKNQGFFPGHNFPFGGVSAYTDSLNGMLIGYPKYPKSFIYRIPRRY